MAAYALDKSFLFLFWDCCPSYFILLIIIVLFKLAFLILEFIWRLLIWGSFNIIELFTDPFYSYIYWLFYCYLQRLASLFITYWNSFLFIEIFWLFSPAFIWLTFIFLLKSYSEIWGCSTWLIFISFFLLNALMELCIYVFVWF